MALQIITGRSGYGKSTYICDYILQQSKENPTKNYFVIVPDQFTMQTQMDFVMKSETGGIMNIDVLSFSRLAHRIFEETGSHRKLVLDDTGKSLILRKIAGTCKEKMPIIGANMTKQGYIHEVKSAISEFMQYGVGNEELAAMMNYAKQQNRKALLYKLQDLQYIYSEFKNYIENHYITTEESMTLLASDLYKSRIIKDSVVVFDGFTGFTPIQESVIESLLLLCETVIVTVTMDTDENASGIFSFAKENMLALEKIARKNQKDIFYKNIERKMEHNKELIHLEKNLFVYPAKVYEGKSSCVEIESYSDIKEEVRSVCRKIIKTIKESGCAYRDIALIVGDLGTYESEVEEEFVRYDIPVYIDRTRGILLNPFMEFIKSALQIQIEDFSYASVFSYLRTGMTDFTEEEIDDLENYVLELNIRGRRVWERVFAKRTKEMRKQESAIEELEYLNGLRIRLVNSLHELSNKTLSVREQVTKLYNFLVLNHVEEQLAEYANLFGETDELKKPDYVKQKEYQQVYGLVMDLFDQLVELMGDELLDVKELLGILEAGFAEIEVGSIPKSVDRVIVGDMERTRLKPVKHLFFLGANDGFIPKSANKGGMISDLDREFLKETEVALSPTPREQMGIQRYYLYLQLTKPSESLHVSYSNTDLQGNPIRPSYLIGLIQKLFPNCVVEKDRNIISNIGNEYEIKEQLSALLLRYAEHTITEQEKSALYVLAKTEDMWKAYLERAFYYYQPENIEQSVAAILYGKKIIASISKMEKYAACAFAHFLQYGLSLKEREVYGLEARDIGSIFHGTLEGFVHGLEANGHTLLDFDEAVFEDVLDKAFENACTQYSEALTYDNSTYLYGMKRMKAIMRRTVYTIAKQLKDGDFTPVAFETKFEHVETIEDMKLHLIGRIDRLDTMEKDDKLYVKVIDYKSSDKDFDLISFYEGQQLQLVVYLGQAVKEMAKKHPNKQVLPAAMLYYHMDDPLISLKKEESDEAIGQMVMEALRTKGLLTTDRDALLGMDKKNHPKSDIIPVSYNKDGSFSSSARVMSAEDLQMLSDFALHSMKRMGKEIIDGHIEKNPLNKGQTDSCTYCSYRSVCDFDERVPGFKMRVLEEKNKDVIMDKIRESVSKSTQ